MGYMGFEEENQLYVTAEEFFSFALPPNTLFCDGGLDAGFISPVIKTGTGSGKLVVNPASLPRDEYKVVVKCESGGELNIDGVTNSGPPPTFAISLDNGVTYSIALIPVTPKGYALPNGHSLLNYERAGLSLFLDNATPTPSFVTGDLFKFTTSPSRDVINAVSAASRIVDGFLRNTYKLPLKKWGADLKLYTSELARWILLTKRGLHQPQTMEPYKPDEAMSWLNEVAKGNIQPSLIESGSPYYFPFAMIARAPYATDWRY